MNAKKIFLLLILFLLSACSSSGAPAEENAVVEEAAASQIKMQDLQGQVKVNDGEKDVEAVAGMNLYNGYGVGTKKDSYDWILLDEAKLMKMDEESKTSIAQEGKKLKITLEEGSLFFCVSKELENDEELSFETENMSLSIRGTCGVIRHYEDWTLVSILEGEAELSMPSRPDEYFHIGEGRSYFIQGDAYDYGIVVAGGDVPDFAQDELNNNETVISKMADSEFEMEYMSDEEVLEAAKRFEGKYHQWIQIGMKTDDPSLDFGVSDPYDLTIEVTDDGLLIIDQKESQEAYDAIENYNRLLDEKGYTNYVRQKHQDFHVETKLIRMENENSLLFFAGGRWQKRVLMEDGLGNSENSPFTDFERVE